jgi:hypothetical protein
MGYKSMALANAPSDPTTRLMQGVKGIWGNGIRLAMAGLICIAGYSYEKLRRPVDSTVYFD